MADDGTGTITVVATADAAVVAAVPTLASELALDDVVAAGWELQGPTATADGGLTLTISHSFTSPDEATNLLNSIGPPFNQMSVQRTTVNNDTTTTLHGLLGLSDGFAAFADDDLVTAVGRSRSPTDRGERCDAGVLDAVTIRAGLPGEIVSEETNGTTVEDGSLEWIVRWTGRSPNCGPSRCRRRRTTPGGLVPCRWAGWWHSRMGRVHDRLHRLRRLGPLTASPAPPPAPPNRPELSAELS